ncbi:MAG: hypothetical protein PHG74_09200 [Kiritimatiellae bacterium]|nr:hypothetical protein [Kiritimatiellia bacterium]MDD3584178.1 hypothetical protein [Kiritimatiellia bacterium]
MKSMSEIMAEVNAQVAGSRFTRIACGAAPGGGGQKAVNPVTLFRGVTRTAKRVGVSQGHLSRVLRGERKAGKELERKLRRMGIRLGEEAAV